MSDKLKQIAVIICTYNRTDDAKINMEIIREIWAKKLKSKEIIIIHAFNGDKEWWPEKYLEDELLYLENPGHFSGAALLMDEGIKAVQRHYPLIEYTIVLAADTWIVKPSYIEKVVSVMLNDEKYLATTTFAPHKGPNWWFTTDFFIINIKWALKYNFFPIQYQEFINRNEEILIFLGIPVIYLEQVVATRYKQALINKIQIPSENFIPTLFEKYIYNMKERDPLVELKEDKSTGEIKPEKKYYWRNIGIICSHDPYKKQKALREWNYELGEQGNSFIKATDLSYFNGGRVYPTDPEV